MTIGAKLQPSQLGELDEVGAVGSKLGVGPIPEHQIAQCSELGEREDSVHQRALIALELGERGEGGQVLGVLGTQGPAEGWEEWNESAAVGGCRNARGHITYLAASHLNFL